MGKVEALRRKRKEINKCSRRCLRLYVVQNAASYGKTRKRASKSPTVMRECADNGECINHKDDERILGQIFSLFVGPLLSAWVAREVILVLVL